MNILLVAPAAKFKFIDPPLGLFYLKSAIDHADFGRSTAIVDLNRRPDFQAALHEYKPDVIGVTATKPLTLPALQVARRARSFSPKVTLIAGGPQPTISPEEFLDDFDIVVRGEGEQTLVETLSILGSDLVQLAGISYKERDRIRHNPSREPIKDLDSIHFPSMDTLDYYQEYQYEGAHMAPLISSRGCAYRCIFCNKDVFGHKVRYRSASNILDEMEQIHQHHGINVFQFRDDTFTINRSVALEFCRASIDRQHGFHWMCNTRADRVDEELIDQMYEAGCSRISYGVETGDQDSLDLLNKGLRVEDILKATHWTHQVGMKVKYFLMVGIPGQSKESIEKTKAIIRKGRPDEIYCSVFLPFPGTYAWRFRERLGIHLRFNPADITEWDKAYYQSNLNYAEAEPPVETSLLSADDIISARREIFEVFNESRR
jgi:anaerobic magnesium-protoporphyrin IX monomethyl ester cyclase